MREVELPNQGLQPTGQPLRGWPAAEQRLSLAVSRQVRGMVTLETSKEVPMSRIEDLEQQVQALSPEELAQFRAWFLEFDWAAWDQQIERDVRDGPLNRLADKALREHASGQTRPL